MLLCSPCSHRPTEARTFEAIQCVAGPDELCMVGHLLRDYVRWKALQAEVAKDLQSPALLAIQNKQDQLERVDSAPRGQVQTLAQQHPGFTFDDAKVRLVKATPPPADAKPAAPAPAPPAKK